MDFFDFLYGDNNNDSSISVDHYVEQFVQESVADLKKYSELSTKALEAEAIYLAAFLYMKDSYQIDFKLDYLSDELVSEIPSGDFSVADKVFTYMMKYGEGYYGTEERDYGLDGYKMNIQLSSDYGNHVKNYFIRAHHLGSGNDYHHFSSPRNCLWRNGIKTIDSPTQRDIYYKFKNGIFELMIPPYNPLVTGRIFKQDNTTIRGESNDGNRTFVFHFKESLKYSNLDYIEMYRNDKGDMISYHKDKLENNSSLDCVAQGNPFDFHFKKMLCTLRKKEDRFGTMFMIEDPLSDNLTANISYKNKQLTIELPKIEDIKDRAKINFDNPIKIEGTFEKVDSSYAPTCYRLISQGITVQLLCKPYSSGVFSFIEIPISTNRPDFRGYDTLDIELDLLQ